MPDDDRQGSPLYGVSDVFNAVMVRGNMVGTLMFYGSGAGKPLTASAVVADIMEAACHMTDNVPLGWSSEKQPFRCQGDAVPLFYPLCRFLRPRSWLMWKPLLEKRK